MYVAVRPIKLPVHGADGRQVSTRVIQPGEEVPGVSGWPYPQIIAHLNLDLIRWDGEARPPHVEHRFATVDMKSYQGAGLHRPKSAQAIAEKKAQKAVRVDERGSPVAEKKQEKQEKRPKASKTKAG